MSQFASPEQVATLSTKLNTLEAEGRARWSGCDPAGGVQERARRSAVPDLGPAHRDQLGRSPRLPRAVSYPSRHQDVPSAQHQPAHRQAEQWPARCRPWVTRRASCWPRWRRSCASRRSGWDP